MKRASSLFIVLFFLFSQSCQVSGGGSGQGYIVYNAVDQDGKPLPEMIVLDASGKELRRIALPEVDDFTNMYSPLPYHPSHRILVQNVDGKFYLVDVDSGKFKELIARDAETDRFSACPWARGGGKHWALLCKGNIAYLVNLETAEIYNGLPRPPADRLVSYDMYFSPDENYLAIRTQEDFSILPTANPDEIRALGKSDGIFYVDFSADSNQITYVRMINTQSAEVVVENVDGLKSSVVHAGDRHTQVFFVPGQKQLLVLEKEKVLLLSLTGHAEQEFPVLPGLQLSPVFAPDGEKVLLTYNNDFTDEPTTWQWADLKRGFTEEVKEIEGYRFNRYNQYRLVQGNRWLVIDDFIRGSEQESIHLARIDLTNGETKQLLQVEDVEDVYEYYEASTSSDGEARLYLFYGKTQKARLWLVRLSQGEAHLVAEDDSVGGSISPDGKRVVVYTRHREGERFEARIELQDTSGKTIKSLGEGIIPFWVWP
jgi:hypothetical protein